MATDPPANPATAPPSTPDNPYVQVQNSAEFAGLRKALRSFVFPTTVAFLVWYGLYVVLSAYARDFMSHKLTGHINVALVFGLLQFVSTFLIAWLYAWYASTRLDPVADRLRGEIEGAGASVVSQRTGDQAPADQAAADQGELA